MHKLDNPMCSDHDYPEEHGYQGPAPVFSTCIHLQMIGGPNTRAIVEVLAASTTLMTLKLRCSKLYDVTIGLGQSLSTSVAPRSGPPNPSTRCSDVVT